MGLPLQLLQHDTGNDLLARPHTPHHVAETGRGEEHDAQFAALAARHAALLFRIALSLLRNPADAEDAVQEALLKLYRTGGWRGMTDEKAFLARTVWRTGLDLIARRPRATDAFEAHAERELPAATHSAEQSLVDHAERLLLRRLLDALPEDLRQPLVLSAIAEMTSREVAAALGIPEGTVRTRVLRARAELRRRFEAMQKTKQETRPTADERGSTRIKSTPGEER